MRSNVRRGWFALFIGLGIQVLLFVLGILTRTPQIPGHPAVLSPLRYFSMPGFVFSLLVVDSVHFMWSLHPVLVQAMQIAANVLFYSVVAYAVLWLRSKWKSNRTELGPASLQTPVMRRVWLPLAIGLAIAMILLAAQSSSFLHATTNNGAGVNYTDAHPRLLTIWLTMSLPGLSMMLLAINVTPVMWGSHPVLANMVVTTGNFLFYSVASYVLLRLTAGLSARWKRT